MRSIGTNSRIFALVLTAFGICGPALAQESPLVLYVSPSGNDAWSGFFAEPNASSTDGPFKTIQHARDVVRHLKGAAKVASPIQVQIREGVYTIGNPIVFTPQDSGTEAAPIAYMAYPGEKPLISGGVRISGWQAEGNLWVTTIPEVAEGKWYFTALWVNGRYQAPARKPNSGFLYTAGKAPEIKNDQTGEVIDRTKTAFLYNEGDIQAWENLEDAMVVAMHSWDTSYHHIASLDEANHVVTFTGPSGWEFEHWGPKQRYYVERVKEALDSPGEWYLNRKTGQLYYWPHEGEDMNALEVIAPKPGMLVQFDGKPAEGAFIDYLAIRGLRFAHTNHQLPAEGMPCAQAAYPVPGTLDGNGLRHCSIEDCEISNVTGYGVWLREGCTDNRIARNQVHHMGAGGIRIGVGNNPASENEATLRNVVDNNWIHNGGSIYPAGVGVYIGRSSENTVSHNEISDIYYTGVSVGWSWGYDPSSANHNIIEYNHIHDIGKFLLSDMGGIYTLGVAPGTTLRYNLIHDVQSFTYGGWGIYPDEGSSELLIENNVVYHTKTGGFHQHYGRENRVQNNVFALATEAQVIRSREEDHISFFFERNIVYFDNGKLLGSTWKNGNFRLDYNCYWDTSDQPMTFAGMTIDEWKAAGQDVHSIIADPNFENAAGHDFRLKPDSPAVAQIGFNPIDISGAGLYGDAAWVDGPKNLPREPYGPPPPAP